MTDLCYVLTDEDGNFLKLTSNGINGQKELHRTVLYKNIQTVINLMNKIPEAKTAIYRLDYTLTPVNVNDAKELAYQEELAKLNERYGK